jgi:hypothetical protein
MLNMPGIVGQIYNFGRRQLKLAVAVQIAGSLLHYRMSARHQVMCKNARRSGQLRSEPYQLKEL